jgi:hypothetical protein
MFAFIKKLFGAGEKSLEEKQKAAHRQDKEVRESLTEKQIDRDVRQTMDASDPVTKY